MAGYSLICCVVNMGDASKALKSAKKYGVKGGTISIGRGTVCNRLLELFALNEQRKEIITMVVERELASKAIKGISEDMAFKKHNHGIAFSYAVAEFIGSKNVVESKHENSEVKNRMYNVIYVVVDRGKGEEVVDAAAEAGGRGGTILNARGAGIHEVQRFFSMAIEPEKEEVFIITKRETKDAIVESIRTHLKIDEPGNGILFVVDVDEVYGLH